MPPDPEFAEEYTKAEIIRFFVFAVLLGAIIIQASKTLLFPWLREFVLSAPCRSILGIERLTFLWYGLFVGIPLHAAILAGALFGRRGYKILRDEQFPPVKEKVYRPTRIQRGSKARVIGYIHLLVFLPFLALTIWGSFQAERMSITTQSKAGICTVNPTKDAPQAAS